jgi:hypothetical protein
MERNMRFCETKRVTYSTLRLPVKLVCRPFVSVSLLLAAFLPNCGADPGGNEAASTREQGTPSPPAALDWASIEAGTIEAEFRVGESQIDAYGLRTALLDLRQAYDVWGPSTLAWHLLDGGLAASALLHDRFAEQSA